jgi:photosystem II stability/assembly factor-like uncharacterized protein
MKKSTLKGITLVIVFTACTFIASAQWKKMYRPSQYWPSNDVKSFGGNLYVAANSGVYRSNDNGATWIDLTQGYAASSSSSFTELFFVGGNIYSRTTTEGVLRSTTGETNWAHDTANIGTSDIKAMYYDSNSGKLFIGLTWPKYGLYSKLPTDPSWTKITNATFGNNFQPVQITRKGTKLFLIDIVSRIFESTDNGLTWIQKTGTNLPQTGAADAAGKFMGIGNILFLGHNGVWKSLDDGNSWSRIDTAFALSFGIFVDTRSLYYDGTTLYAGVYAGGNTYSSPDLGNSWYAMGGCGSFIKSMVKHNGALYGSGHGSDSIYVYGAVSGISELDLESHAQLFPNPANEKVSIANVPAGSRITLMDMNGKCIYSGLCENELMTINTSGLESGIYCIRINYDGAVANKKLVISR